MGTHTKKRGWGTKWSWSLFKPSSSLAMVLKGNCRERSPRQEVAFGEPNSTDPVGARRKPAVEVGGRMLH